MGFAQTYIELLVQKAKVATTIAPRVASAEYDLPGLKPKPSVTPEELSTWKKEYTLNVKSLQADNKKLGGMKGAGRKDLREKIKRTKEWMEKLKASIGTMSDDERLNGFAEVCDAE
jgi:hypothetical protein